MMTRVCITGGAGFIGVNIAEYYLKRGYRVSILDNFSRAGSSSNAEWLHKMYQSKVEIVEADVTTDIKKINRHISHSDIIFHMAAQVAVTTSLKDPKKDLLTNTLGTLNILEEMRKVKSKAIFLYASTNKVYGSLESLKLRETPTRYMFTDRDGISETFPLDFHTPYGCSKGSADQYVRDYARIYGLNTIVFRQSCIYGPHQFGIEDQGWVAWFLISALMNKKTTIYGDGKQVRDLLYISDLLEAYDEAINHAKKTIGQVYNIGGGPKNSLSIWREFSETVEALSHKKISPMYRSMRIGDQKIFISDTSKAKLDFDWEPDTSIAEGMASLFEWLTANKHLL